MRQGKVGPTVYTICDCGATVPQGEGHDCPKRRSPRVTPATPTPARSEAAGGEDVALRIRAEQAEKERQYWIARCREKDQQLLVEQGRVVTLERVARAKEEANESLRQQLAAAREDAERYRFLRDNPLGFRAVDGAASVPPHPTVMDRWVDAARAEAGRETEGGR